MKILKKIRRLLFGKPRKEMTKKQKLNRMAQLRAISGH